MYFSVVISDMIKCTFSVFTSSKNKLRLLLKIAGVIIKPWRCQRCNQNPQIEVGQTTKWPIEKS